MKIFRKCPDNIKLDFVVSTDSGYYEREVLERGGLIYRVPMRTKNPISAFFKIKKIVRDNNYKYVLKLCDTPIGVFDLLASRIGGATVLCVRSCNAQSEEGLLLRVINYWLRPIFNGIANVKIAPSKLAANYTFGKKEVQKGNVFILKNGLDISLYRFDEISRNKIREEFGFTDNFIVGHIGRFSKQKNHLFLIDVFREIEHREKNAILFLVGEGELEEQVKKYIAKYHLQKKVVFAGVRLDIPSILSAMDVFVFPSFYEGMPNTVIEAQTAGLPCVISDTITDEVKITNLVDMVSIKERPEKWADLIMSSRIKNRRNVSMEILNAGYDINDVARDFIEKIFSRGKLN